MLIRDFFLQLQIIFITPRVECAALQGRGYGAAGFREMLTIAKAALLPQRENVFERIVKTLAAASQLQFAHAGRVH